MTTLPPSPYSFSMGRKTKPASTTLTKENPLITRKDLQDFLVSLLEPLEQHFSPGGAFVHLGYTGTHFDERAAWLEGYARPLWGLAALVAGELNSASEEEHSRRTTINERYPFAHRWIQGLISGTDSRPSHDDEYWGDIGDKDQRMVECSPIGFALIVAGGWMWDGLGEEEKDRVGRWLGGLNGRDMPNTNWLWFRVFANLGLSRVSSPYASPTQMRTDLGHLDSQFYIGDGWSRDGPEGVLQLDYYSSSFAIQVAQLIYSKVAWEEDRERCVMYRERAVQFAGDFVRYFDEEGRAIPFGRSMTYRFATSAFFSALAFSLLDPSHPSYSPHLLPPYLSPGHLKGFLLRNIRVFQPHNCPGAYNADGTFTIGYTYPNQFMTENYNSPGSPYWACKAFLCLALPPDSPFWTSSSPELSYPKSYQHTIRVLPKPMHIASNLASHTFILSSGQMCSYHVRAGAAKYGKFVYSSAFGFSVPSGSGSSWPVVRGGGVGGTWGGGGGMEEEAGDSALGVCVDGEVWRCRRRTEGARFEGGDEGGDGTMSGEGTSDEGNVASTTTYLRSSWHPYPASHPQLEIETFLVPPHPETPCWHVRVHRVVFPKRLRSRLTRSAGTGNGKKEEEEKEKGEMEGLLNLVTCEGGFAIYGQGEDGRALREVSSSLLSSLGQSHGGGPIPNGTHTSTQTQNQATLDMNEKGAEALAHSLAGFSGIVDLPIPASLSSSRSKTTTTITGTSPPTPAPVPVTSRGTGRRRTVTIARRTPRVLRTDANTNLVVPRAVVPSLIWDASDTSSSQDVCVVLQSGGGSGGGGDGEETGLEGRDRPASEDVEEVWYLTGVFASPDPGFGVPRASDQDAGKGADEKERKERERREWITQEWAKRPVVPGRILGIMRGDVK